MGASTQANTVVEIAAMTARLRAYLPGALIAIAVTGLAVLLSRITGLPLMLLALLAGLAAHPVTRWAPSAAGLRFAAKSVLRLGVALLGAGVVASEIAGLGWPVLLLCVAGVGLTIAVGLLTARMLGESRYSGLLFGGAVAICGASAALAVASVLPQNKDTEANTLLAVIGVTALSTVAMVAYPALALQFDLSDKAAGIFFGAAIHDVAQVVGAGYIISESAGETATMVKLVRVACLVPVVALIAFAMRGSSEDSPAESGERSIPLLPLFLVGFVALSALASTGWVPASVMEGAADLGKVLLVVAIAALGCLTSVGALVRIGLAPVVMLLVPTLALGAFSLAAILLLPALSG